MSEDMAAAFAGAVNQWMAAEFLEPGRQAARLHRDPDPERRWLSRRSSAGPDKRFVSVLMLVMDENPLGRRL